MNCSATCCKCRPKARSKGLVLAVALSQARNLAKGQHPAWVSSCPISLRNSRSWAKECKKCKNRVATKKAGKDKAAPGRAKEIRANMAMLRHLHAWHSSKLLYDANWLN